MQKLVLKLLVQATHTAKSFVALCVVVNMLAASFVVYASVVVYR